MELMKKIFDRLEEELKKKINSAEIIENSLWDKAKEKWVLGFSGGPDSVFLLKTLLKFREERKFEIELVLVHINHMLRGGESEADEKFSREIAEKHGLKIYVKRADIETVAAERKMGLEEAGREIRHEFFKEIKKKEQCNRIALAHNKDDQIETFLFRMIRGTGLKGLEGIAYSKEGYIRPVVEIYKSEIMKHLDDWNIPYRIDKSNFESDFTRNSIRLDLIPFIEKRYNPKFKDKIFNLLEEIKETNRELKIEYRNFLGTENKISLEKLSELSDFNKKKILAEFLGDQGYSCDRYKLEKIVELIQRGGTKKVSLSKEVFVVKDYQYIFIEKNERNTDENKGKFGFHSNKEIELKIPGKAVIGDYEIEAVICGNGEKKNGDRNTILTNFRKDDILKIRNRKNGDRMIPLGMDSEKKVKDIMINDKVPQNLRDSIPIFIFKEEIFWIGGIRVSEKYLKKKGDNQWTELILRRIH